jgi:hypothetical protein
MRLFILVATATASLALLSIPSVAETGATSSKTLPHPVGWCTFIKTSDGTWTRICDPAE